MGRKNLMKRNCQLICLGVFSLLLISCLSTLAGKKVAEKRKTAEGLRHIYVTNSKKIELLLPEYSSGVFEGLQSLSGTFGNKSFWLLSYTQIDSKGISLSLMNDFGGDMGNISYDGNQVIFDSAYFSKNLPGEYIICDIQNAFYDAAALEENYAAVGLTFETLVVLRETGEPEEYRRIFDGKKLIEEIIIYNGSVSVENFLRGYEYKLTKVEE